MDTGSIKNVTAHLRGVAVLSGTATILHWQPLPHNNEMAGHVGEVASAWAHLDRAVDACLRRAGCQCEQKVPDTRPVREKLEDLHDKHTANVAGWVKKDIATLMEEFPKQKDRPLDLWDRHRIIHDPWMLSNEGKPAQWKNGGDQLVERSVEEVVAVKAKIKEQFQRVLEISLAFNRDTR